MASHDAGPAPNDSISVSTTFGLGRNPAPDCCLVSSDSVFFYIHLRTIHRLCPDAFKASIDSSPPTSIDEMKTVLLDCPSDQLNLIIHALYDLSPQTHEPSPDTIISSVDLMPIHAIRPEQIIDKGCALYDYILTFLPLRPLDVYSMAAHHNIPSLAVHASSYLLGLDVQSIPEEICVRMGPVYLTRLARLQIQRFNALKNILLVAPEMHAATLLCDFRNQQRATRVWAELCANPIWDTKPADLAVQVIGNTLQQTMDGLACPDCRKSLERAASKVRLKWASAPRTISLEVQV